MRANTLLNDNRLRYIVKPSLFVVLLLPAINLAWGAWHGSLGADPQKYLLHQCGLWAVRCLWLTLLISPLRKRLQLPPLLKLRRMLGLYAFFYACLHLFVYYALYLDFDWRNALEDVVERPYIVIGATAFLLLIPLALTSTQAMMKRLGRRWQQLHKAVYIIAVLAVVHFWWQVKADIREPLFYAVVLSLLFAARIRWPFTRDTKSVTRASSPEAAKIKVA